MRVPTVVVNSVERINFCHLVLRIFYYTHRFDVCVRLSAGLCIHKTEFLSPKHADTHSEKARESEHERIRDSGLSRWCVT